MTQAVIRTGGKQYRVAAGDTVKIEKLEGSTGDSVQFDQILLLSAEGKVQVGKPTIPGAKVEGKIVDQGRGPKLIVFKFRRRKRYRRKNGHRQDFTAVQITTITG
ncbi:MAG: 50S ribosomal protein L21 [Polyangiaceae bacterium]|nr:50S ribosomal protein L21 [Polyangiaceae bacterium]